MDRKIVWLLALCVIAAPVFAQDTGEKPGPADKAIEEIASALAEENVAKARALLESAEAIAAKLDNTEQLDQIVAAYGVCIRKTQRKNPLVAIAAVESLGDLQVRGSSKIIKPLLKVPRKVPGAKRQLFLTGIESAGEIHDPATLPDLEKLVNHTDTEIAVAATKALVGYRDMKRSERLKLLDRLAKSLATFERRAAKSKKEEVRDHANELLSHLRASMTKLAASSTATTAKEWQAWVKQETKRERARRLKDG